MNDEFLELNKLTSQIMIDSYQITLLLEHIISYDYLDSNFKQLGKIALEKSKAVSKNNEKINNLSNLLAVKIPKSTH